MLCALPIQGHMKKKPNFPPSSTTSLLVSARSTDEANTKERNRRNERNERNERSQGRKHQFNTKSLYFLPTTEAERGRQTIQHVLVKWAFKTNFMAPVKDVLVDGGRVLDIGCGGGDWILDMARDFPASTFHGLDIAESIFPVAPLSNTIFRQGNVAAGLPYPDAHFDYVFQRFLSPGLTCHMWETVLREAYRTLKPGGFLEVVDVDLRMIKAGPASKQYMGLSEGMLKMHGVDPRFVKNVFKNFAAAGFVNIRKAVICMPFGAHGKQFGLVNSKMAKQLFNDLKPPIMHFTGVREPEINDLMVKYFDELDNGSMGINHYIVYAQKPFSD